MKPKTSWFYHPDDIKKLAGSPVETPEELEKVLETLELRALRRIEAEVLEPAVRLDRAIKKASSST